MSSTACDDQFAPEPQQPPSGQSAAPIPDVLFDSYAVLSALGEKAKSRTSPENVADVLDAVVKLLRAQPAAATPDEIEGLRAHVALLKAALAQAERENDELRAKPAAATVPADEREAFTKWAECEYRNIDAYSSRDYTFGLEAWQARAALAAPAAPQAGEDAASQVEHLDVENHRLRRAMQKIMARLADLLDEDQFGNIESIVTEAGVEPPEPGDITTQGESRGDQ